MYIASQIIYTYCFCYNIHCKDILYTKKKILIIVELRSPTLISKHILYGF